MPSTKLTTVLLQMSYSGCGCKLKIEQEIFGVLFVLDFDLEKKITVLAITEGLVKSSVQSQNRRM